MPAGNYRFGVLPSGNFRIDTVNPIINYVFVGDTDNAAARIDTDGGALGSVTITGLGEGATAAAGVGYVRDNDAPVNTLPASPTTLEDTPLPISGISSPMSMPAAARCRLRSGLARHAEPDDDRA